MSRDPGLSDVVNNGSDIQSVVREWQSGEGLKVITAGKSLTNITEVIASKKISTVLSELKKNHELVIIDAPPLIIADSFNLAANADGVIVVLEPGQTTDDQAKAIKEQLGRANARIIGFVFNKISRESARGYGDYQSQSLSSAKYYGDYISDTPKESATVSPSRRLIDFFEHGKFPAHVAPGMRTRLSKNREAKRNGKS